MDTLQFVAAVIITLLVGAGYVAACIALGYLPQERDE
jgi:hypothetical protein